MTDESYMNTLCQYNKSPAAGIATGRRKGIYEK
nr:MAG TPA: hypothetical protein [Caudoviricetes sp.]